MNDSDISEQTRDLWKRAKQIYFTTTTNSGDKNQAERYFSMISSVVEEEGKIIFGVSSSFAADLLEKEYAQKIKRCLRLAGARVEE